MSDQVTMLLEKAAKAEKADDAMKFAQAALNASQALYNTKLPAPKP